MKHLIVVNDAPYASERPYNALRLAAALASDGAAGVRLFFLGDGAWCAVRDHKVPEGMHDIEAMLRGFVIGPCPAVVCGTCMKARGITPDMLIEEVRPGTLDELTAWTEQADKALVF